MTATRPITIMIVDDHVVIRSGLRMLIEHDQRMQVVAQAGNKGEALERAASAHPDVIILDLVLGDEDGLSFLPELCQASPTSRVLVLTGVQNPDAHRRAIRRGAMGIVLKEHAADQLLKAIMKVNDGEVWIERSMMGSMIQEFNKPAMVDPNARNDSRADSAMKASDGTLATWLIVPSISVKSPAGFRRNTRSTWSIASSIGIAVAI